MTLKFEEHLRYLSTKCFTQIQNTEYNKNAELHKKIGPGPTFGSFFSENRPRAYFAMGSFSESPGISHSFSFVK